MIQIAIFMTQAVAETPHPFDGHVGRNFRHVVRSDLHNRFGDPLEQSFHSEKRQLVSAEFLRRLAGEEPVYTKAIVNDVL